jgi:phosphoserine aminotransferase
VFAQPIEWSKCDVVTFSWQKVLGGEAAHGMLILSPRAVARLEKLHAAWPLPKIFRMTKKGKLDQDLFEGATINTPSLLATEDYLDALKWAERIGGLAGAARARDANAGAGEWVARTPPWVDFLVSDPRFAATPASASRSSIRVTPSAGGSAQAEFAKKPGRQCWKGGVALDAASYRSAPPGLRIWCGATIEQSDLQALTPWLDWAFASCLAQLERTSSLTDKDSPCPRFSLPMS